MTLGQRIRKARKAQGLTMKDMEKKSYVGVHVIRHIETDKASPYLCDLEAICSVLGINLLAILREDFEPYRFEELKRMHAIKEKLDDATGTIQLQPEEKDLLRKVLGNTMPKNFNGGKVQ
jgi:transcriptional regulator with XRE-family HTH domain